MAPKSIFRQPGAQHFQLVHRSQRDPLIHDPEASQHVLKPFERENVKKGKSRSDLENVLPQDQLAHDLQRANIGEASLFGVYYDDTEYDYMQHLRTVGLQEDGVESVLLEAPAPQKSKVGKKKEIDFLTDLPPEALPSTSELPRDYDAHQAIPTELSGLQPDMDPHLRQVLEALEDDAFVDEDLEEDFFGELVKDGEKNAGDEISFPFREEGFSEGSEDINEVGNDKSWENQFALFKRHQELQREMSDDGQSEEVDTIGDLPDRPVVGGKRRKKGRSDASGYSMSSSSMFRNEGLTLLDERFDKVEKEYAEDDDDDGLQDSDSDSSAPDLMTSREDFNAIMDDFLDNYELVGRRMRPVLHGTTGADKLQAFRAAMGEDDRVRQSLEGDNDEDDQMDRLLDEYEKDRNQDRWDCETIQTTYTNLENHPRLIKARDTTFTKQIKLDPKTGLPGSKPTHAPRMVAQKAPSNPTEKPPVTNGVIARPKDESKEEKKARKNAVKAERQSRRVEKKIIKEQFSNETKQQLKRLATKEKSGIRKL
ncbi:Low temperature viability protein [Rickenella mellea]|uniref:Low temperature viability protein n=1 Tax=Rickenella mellea TaxID=50990 RepID=A0A4Y7QLD3_9AGAM|nr:Low temperature viability protein [Rickenella mellea]